MHRQTAMSLKGSVSGAARQVKPKQVCMIVYTEYRFDARVRREAEILAASDHFEVTVLCLKEKPSARAYTMDNVWVRELNAAKYKGGGKLGFVVSYLRFLVMAFMLCSGMCARGKIDIVHVHNMPNFLVLAALLPKLSQKKVILDMHDSMPELLRDKFEGRVGLLLRMLYIEEKLSALISDKVVCVNEVQKNVIVKRGIPPEKIRIFMNVPDHKKFSEAGKTPVEAMGENPFRIAYHGTVSPRLGVDMAIEAVTKLREELPNLQFHLWGDGPYFDYLRRKNQESDHNGTVFFHERVPLQELARHLREMDAGLIPSRRSAATELMLPVKMLEYVAMGIPVVAPRLEAIEYYFSEEMITFFEPGDVDAMAKAILKVYASQADRLSQSRNAKKFLSQYGWEKQSVDFINYYKGL